MSGKRKSITGTLGVHSIRHMPVIDEDNHDAPPLPEKSTKRSDLGFGAHLKHPPPGYPPPAYSNFSYSTTTNSNGPPSEHPPKDIKPGWLARRGGWYRLALIGLVAAGCIIALAVGLALGLRHRSSTNSMSGNQSHPLLFPAGSYAFTTALANISRACTSNSNTFRCYPYTTYETSQTGSSATFYWTITQVSGWDYVISAAPNPFVPQFTNVSLDVLDLDQTTERMTFNFTMNLAVVPDAPLDASNTAATCYFNDTVMGATIWTRKPAEFPQNLGSSVSSAANGTQTSSDFDNWPYAVQVSQVAASGGNVPDCRNTSGGSVGSFGLSAGMSGDCSCDYTNFGLGS
ncbi:hypothetical protein BJ170DRAFT_684168 [Xylariales sp. AK1849]|nr:hypothetical protein BJ170DRAFT_684168 [Xylariales sp. AK1849]